MKLCENFTAASKPFQATDTMNNEGSHANKKQKTYSFHKEWESRFPFTNVKYKCVCLICRNGISVGKKSNVERHHSEVHANFSWDIPGCSTICAEMVKEVKAILPKTAVVIHPTTEAMEALFKAVHILTKHKNPFTDKRSDDRNGGDFIQRQ